MKFLYYLYRNLSFFDEFLKQAALENILHEYLLVFDFVYQKIEFDFNVCPIGRLKFEKKTTFLAHIPGEPEETHKNH